MSKLFNAARQGRIITADALPEPVDEIFRSVNKTADAEVPSKAEAGAGNQAAGVSCESDDFRRVHVSRSALHVACSEGDELSQSATEAYRSLRTRVLRLQATMGLHSVVLASATPGEGKTLTTVNLGLACAHLYQTRVLLVDADLLTGGLSQLMELPTEGPGLVGVLAGRVVPQHAVLAADIPNLYVMPAGDATTAPPELFAGAHWKEFIAWSSKTFNLVLVDSPPIGLADFELITAACDGMLFVVRAHKTGRELAASAVAQIDHKKLLGVVLNGAQSSRLRNYSRYYGSYYGKELRERAGRTRK